MLKISITCYHQWHLKQITMAFLFEKIGVKLTATLQAGLDVYGAESHGQRGSVDGCQLDNLFSMPRSNRA